MPRKRTVDRSYIKQWYREKSAKEIAKHLGCQVQTVYSIAYDMGVSKLSHASSWEQEPQHRRTETKPKADPRKRITPNVVAGISMARLMAGR